MNKLSKIMAMVLFVAVITIAIPVMSATILDIDVVETGTTTSVSYLTVGIDYEFRLWVENDYRIQAMQFGFAVWSDNGATWEWRNVGGVGTLGCVTMVSGSRLDGAFELIPLDVLERDMDEISPDTLVIYGAAMMNRLEVGPSEHMVSFHFRPTETGTICIDSTIVPPYTFYFVDDYGVQQIPEVAWPSGGRCWEVIPDYVCGDANNDEVVNILDVTHLISYLYKGGPDPERLDSFGFDAGYNRVSSERKGGGICDRMYLII